MFNTGSAKCAALNPFSVRRWLADQRTHFAVATGGSGETSETPRYQHHDQHDDQDAADSVVATAVVAVAAITEDEHDQDDQVELARQEGDPSSQGFRPWSSFGYNSSQGRTGPPVRYRNGRAHTPPLVAFVPFSVPVTPRRRRPIFVELAPTLLTADRVTPLFSEFLTAFLPTDRIILPFTRTAWIDPHAARSDVDALSDCRNGRDRQQASRY